MMATYIFQTIVFQLVFLLVYELFLKEETFFEYNRGYLLLTPFLALLLPLMEFETLGAMVTTEKLVLLPELYLSSGGEQVAGKEYQLFSSKEFWLGLYFFGSLVSLIVGLGKVAKLRRLFRHPIYNESKGYKIVSIPDSTLACTFFNTVFLGDQLREQERKQILSHELVHVQQKHSLDLLLFEILRVVLWFNPLIFVYQSKIAELHEYLADAEVVKEVEKRNYYQQLLNTAFNTQNISFINQFFNHSLIKKRIVMLQKSKSKSIAKSKFLILLPLLLGMLVYVSCSEETLLENEEPVLYVYEEDRSEVGVVEDTPSGVEVIEIVEDTNFKTVEDVPFALIEEVPVYPGCEGLEGQARKECMTAKITEFVGANFDSSLGKKLGLTGMNKIYVQFKITTEGKVEVMGVHGPVPELEEEARRVVSSLPNMEPGIQRGEVVPVLYSLPIIFEVGE